MSIYSPCLLSLSNHSIRTFVPISYLFLRLLDHALSIGLLAGLSTIKEWAWSSKVPSLHNLEVVVFVAVLILGRLLRVRVDG